MISKPNERKQIDEAFLNDTSNYPSNSLNTNKYITDAIKTRGRILLHETFFIWFADYFPLYKNTISILLNDDVLLPITWKYYLAIMAASTIRCEYLLKHLEAEFLFHGGDEEWLEFGLIKVPKKLKKLDRINNILAHQPWKLKQQDLQV